MKDVEKFLDKRSLIYVLLLGSSLLFLLNLKYLITDVIIYFLFAIFLLFAILTEFIFSIERWGRIYHKEHILKDIFTGYLNHKLFHFVLFTFIEYLCCIFIIYINSNILIDIIFIILASITSYLGICAYEYIYEFEFKNNFVLDYFLDTNKYLCYFFILYIVFWYRLNFDLPKLGISIFVFVLQLIFLCLFIWRRNKLNIENISFSVIFSIVTGVLIYIKLYFANTTHLDAYILVSASFGLVLNYFFSQILNKISEGKITFFKFWEYFCISISLLVILLFL